MGRGRRRRRGQTVVAPGPTVAPSPVVGVGLEAIGVTPVEVEEGLGHVFKFVNDLFRGVRSS